MDTANQPGKLRWSRAQRFRLTDKGTSAEQRWQATLAEVRTSGRELFDAARGRWATEFAVQPDDSTFLSELTKTSLRLEDVAKAVADTGTSREDVKKALERLVVAGLIETQVV